MFVLEQYQPINLNTEMAGVYNPKLYQAIGCESEWLAR
jgi:hypothetical protein